MSAPARTSLIHRYLDPVSSLGEILFGLIMTLTFTLGAGIIIEDEGREGARQLLIALIGCNIAWGVIDGALYIVGEWFDRDRLRRVARAVRTAANEQAAARLVAGEMDGLLDHVLSDTDRVSLYQRIAKDLRTRAAQARTVIVKADILGAITSFWLVVLSSVPAAVPFLIFDNARFALRVSNAVLLALLFLTGYAWARHTLGRPWLVGFLFLIFGTGLVVVAIALGG